MLAYYIIVEQFAVQGFRMVLGGRFSETLNPKPQLPLGFGLSPFFRILSAFAQLPRQVDVPNTPYIPYPRAPNAPM